jgi:hypothetical protein
MADINRRHPPCQQETRKGSRACNHGRVVFTPSRQAGTRQAVANRGQTKETGEHSACMWIEPGPRGAPTHVHLPCAALAPPTGCCLALRASETVHCWSVCLYVRTVGYMFLFIYYLISSTPCTSEFCHSRSATVPFSCLSFSFPPPAELILIPILIPPYSPRLAKIKKTHMSSRRFEPVTSQAKTKSSYRYTTYVFMSTSMIGNTSIISLTKLTCYPCTMRSSR